jgi:hypothetical protein
VPRACVVVNWRKASMKFSWSFVLGLVLSVTLSPATAQESTRLQFEILKDGSTVAKPGVTVVAVPAVSFERI